MPNVFTGVVLNQKGEPVQQAQIQITQDGVVLQSGLSLTDEKGNFRIQVNEPVDSKKITLTVTKDGKEIRSISNPNATSTITAANLQIRKEEGGQLVLKGKYEGGEYYFESLGGKGNPGDLIRDEFDLNMLELEGLIKNCTQKNIPLKIIITGSESTIPNTDNEPFLPDGKTTNPNYNKPITEDKGLAKKRVEYLNKHVTEKLFSLDNKTWVGRYNAYKEETYQVNGPPYPGNADYKQYQYVSISALPSKCTCTPVYFSPTPSEVKDVTYVAPGSKTCAFNAFQIPDRFGFNNYLLPYYILNSPTTIVSANRDTYARAWGLLIYMYLYLKNNKSTSFLDVTTPGLKLNYTILENKELYLQGTQAEQATYNKNSLKYVLEQFKKALDPNPQNIYGIQVLALSFDKLLTDYPNEFSLPRQSATNPNTVTRVPVLSTDDYRLKVLAVNEFIDRLIKSNIPVAAIEVLIQREAVIEDITKPEYGLTPDGFGNKVIGISGSPLPLKSVWAYCICGDTNGFPWLTGGKGGVG